MRTPIGAVVSAERAVAQGSPHRVTERRHVVDLRRERRAGPAPPGERHVAIEGRRLLDAPRNVAPHQLGLDPVHARCSTVSPFVRRQFPEAPFAVSTTSPGQMATPESASEHVNDTVTGPTYQPLLPFTPLLMAPVMVGAVLSSLTVTESVPGLPATSFTTPLRVATGVFATSIS